MRWVSPCARRQTQTVYFVCAAKRLRLGSPFLFSQWKGEIDGYHLCGIALFERYQIFSKASLDSSLSKHPNINTLSHTLSCVFHVVPQFSVQMKRPLSFLVFNEDADGGLRAKIERVRNVKKHLCRAAIGHIIQMGCIMLDNHRLRGVIANIPLHLLRNYCVPHVNDTGYICK